MHYGSCFKLKQSNSYDIKKIQIIQALAKELIKLRDLLKLQKYFIGYIQIHKFMHSVQLHAS